MFGILEAVAVPHSGVFDTYEDLMKELNGRMEKEGYKIVKARSHRSRMGGADIPGNEIVRCDLVCDRGGRPYKCMATKHKTTTKKTDCPWKAKAVNRKTIGGWVLTISCDQHNHAPGTPEPPTPSEASDDEANNVEEELDLGPRPDTETSTAMQLAGVSEPNLRLTGDAFHQLKTDYRKMAQPDRLNALAQLQLRLAAIYAVQNEDWQRQRRQEAQDKRHQQVDQTRKQTASQKQRMRRQRRQTEPIPQPDVSQQPLPQSLPGSQMQQDAQAAQIQPLMQDAHFQLGPGSGHAQAPLAEMTMQQFQHFSNPPKQMRGHRPGMPGQPDIQQL
ncbi:hypothetical protein ESCO_004527 [Escovopsis weberi]|uniref:FAR1 domain-containing protein n=1 Tax=Escovopsis weberi TaxID=150374 RepID=A0A0M8N6C8_ESCWE|nr:hypothetical protein ESCO_004527 [Escovopsis weberi]